MSEPVKSYLGRGHRVTAIRIGNACAVLHRLHKTMHLRLASMFLIVGQEEGLTVSELAQRCGVRKTIASRYLSDLGIINRHGGPGAGLITTVQRVYGDRRERRVYLTQLGEEAFQQIYEALTEARPRPRF